MLLSQQSHQWSNQSNSSFTNNYDRQQKSDNRINNSQGRPLLTGPIPATPDYEYDTRATSAPYSSRGIARVHGSDAKAIHKRATNGTGVPFLFEVQGTGLSSIHGTAAKPPINHLNENVKRIRHVMRESRQRQITKEQNKPIPVKALWHSKQYDHVQSKVKQRLEEETHRSVSRPQSARGNFLHAHENTGPQYLRSQSVSSSRRGSIASSIDLGTTQLDDRSKPDYVKINSQYVKNIPKVRKTMSEEIVEQARAKKEQQLNNYYEKQKGRVPDYIEKIREQRTQEINDERANAPDPDCPLGHVKIDNDKRLSTLRQLQLNRIELEKKLSHLPIRNDSLTLRRTKEEIEKKIIELDEAIKIFSKPKTVKRKYHLSKIMVYIRFHLPVLLSSYSIVTHNVNYNLIRLYSIYLMFFSQIILSSCSKFDDKALTIAKSIDDYTCQNFVFTCFFRQRHHTSYNNQQQQHDNCKFLLILHSCLYYDTDTIRRCHQSKLNPAKINLRDEAPKHCFTSSVYKNFYVQHLRSISPARTTVKCQIFILLFLLISCVIKIKVCC
ncbi:unnamed protein product [Rotaria sordida]|uniref:Enkurin domain-containing protein n=1 Tax=Rotaria sordida TaxID=392033 RepID=A0A814K358_9BILA|nr:unnamed protein product [Rotaria sordida]CAF1339467.1 unnamed protein product [Rotaria sordida]